METKPPVYVRVNIPRRIKSIAVTLPVFWMAARSVFWGRESNWLELNNSPQSSCTHTAGKLQTAHWTPERDIKGIRKLSKRLERKKKVWKPYFYFWLSFLKKLDEQIFADIILLSRVASLQIILFCYYFFLKMYANKAKMLPLTSASWEDWAQRVRRTRILTGGRHKIELLWKNL